MTLRNHGLFAKKQALIFSKVFAATQQSHERTSIFHLDNSRCIARQKEQLLCPHIKHQQIKSIS
jgi:hypothetical protein